MDRWIKWKGIAKTEKGMGYFSVTPRGEFGLAGIGTRKKYFNPGMKGTNGVEVTLVEFAQEGDVSSQ